jgi:L-fuconolactonase
VEDAIRLVRDFPDQTFVLDHIAKPKIRSNQIQAWRTKMTELALHANISVKLSGMLTEADHRAWTLAQLLPYWEVVLEAFGPDRILYGSDWPVVLLAGQYARWVEIVTQWLSRLNEPDRAKIWGGNANRIYLNG